MTTNEERAYTRLACWCLGPSPEDFSKEHRYLDFRLGDDLHKRSWDTSDGRLFRYARIVELREGRRRTSDLTLFAAKGRLRTKYDLDFRTLSRGVAVDSHSLTVEIRAACDDDLVPTEPAQLVVTDVKARQHVGDPPPGWGALARLMADFSISLADPQSVFADEAHGGKEAKARAIIASIASRADHRNARVAINKMLHPESCGTHIHLALLQELNLLLSEHPYARARA